MAVAGRRGAGIGEGQMPEIPRGRFIWFDLLTTDPARAAGFYPRITGWGTTPAAVPGSRPYTIWTNKSVPLGGVTTLPDASTAPHWLGYIATPDVDGTIAQALGLGGRVVAPASDIQGVGRYAVLADPQGAAFGVFRPAGDAGHDGAPKRGEFSWHELAATDIPSALEFYRTLFGWDAGDSMDMGEAGIYQMYRRNGQDIGGIYKKPPAVTGPAAWLHYILVDDVQRAVETTKDRGGQIATEPMEVPGGDRIAVAVDPTGAMFAVHAKKR
jgi:predicted enzyme related to lactoylglutathione lyase